MRQHIEHILAAFGALGFALFISYFNTGPSAVTVSSLGYPNTLIPVSETHPHFTPAITPQLFVPTTTIESLIPRIASGTSTVAQKPKRPASTPEKAAPPIPATFPQTAPVIPKPSTPPVIQPTQISSSTTTSITGGDQLLSSLSASIVNILCTSHQNPLRGISGSGVIIDSRGIILTVAHVAQADLLQEALGSNVISCVIRTGSPAHSAYTARLIYISQAWLHKNSTTLISSQPTGTGENDFALLAITGTTGGGPLPTSFSAVHLASGDSSVGDVVGIGSYGAQYLTSAEVRNNLNATLIRGSIKDVFTFDTSTVDVLSISGGAAAQEGSSGGAVIDTSGRLIGIITTSEINGSSSTRQLRAITAGHIRSSYNLATGKDFDTSFDSASLTTSINEYAPTVQTLGDFLAKAIGLR